MNMTYRLQYLEAMGIQIWQLRDAGVPPILRVEGGIRREASHLFRIRGRGTSLFPRGLGTIFIFRWEETVKARSAPT